MTTPALPTRRPWVRALVWAAVLVVLGGAALRGAGATGRGNPTASVDNGAPRGLLGARLLLERDGTTVAVARDLAPLADGLTDGLEVRRLLILVPPPERDGLSPVEVDDLLALATRGARLVVLCDGDARRTRRLGPLLTRLGIECVVDGDAPISTTASSLVPGLPLALVLRDRARLQLGDVPGVLPLAAVGETPVAAVRSVGRGDAIVLASASSLANDGLAAGDGATLLRWLTQGRTVLVDERHHDGRGRAVVRRARVDGAGPLAALVSAALLVVGSLLALAPRAGDTPQDWDDLPAPTTTTRVRGLAALLARARRDAGAKLTTIHIPPHARGPG
jgi:hypothetical protein